MSKNDQIQRIHDLLASNGLSICEEDTTKPWGAYFRIEATQSQKFIDLFFKDFTMPSWSLSLRTDPKILLVAPNKRLSWQYHDRRGEVWKVLTGPISVMLSSTDDMSDPKKYVEGEIIEIACGTRHRLIGLDDWGVVAEIWVSTDPDHPTDEADNHRLQDDFGRK